MATMQYTPIIIVQFISGGSNCLFEEWKSSPWSNLPYTPRARGYTSCTVIPRDYHMAWAIIQLKVGYNRSKTRPRVHIDSDYHEQHISCFSVVKGFYVVAACKWWFMYQTFKREICVSKADASRKQDLFVLSWIPVRCPRRTMMFGYRTKQWKPLNGLCETLLYLNAFLTLTSFQTNAYSIDLSHIVWIIVITKAK